MEESRTIDTSDERLNVLLDQVTDLLTSFVVPLYRLINKKPVSFGSGFFVRKAEDHFLISAAHVLELLPQEPLYYYFAPGQMRKLSGRLALSRWTGDREQDPIDVGVLRLKDRPPPYPDVGKLAMEISYLRSSLLPRFGRVYALIGFPASKSKVNRVAREVTAACFAIRTRSVDDAVYVDHNASPAKNIVLSLDLEDCVDVDGRHRNFPKPQGMSGGPIWVLMDEPHSTTSRVFPVVAIGTKYRKRNKVLIGTDIGIALRMINEAV